MKRTTNIKAVDKVKECSVEYTTSIRPILKWAGGKNQLLEQFENYYPIELKFGLIKNYYEPFLGGGAVFFDIVQKYHVENAYLFDINAELILVYSVLQNYPNELIEELEIYKRKYNKLNENERSNLFYQVREEYNNNLDVNHIYKKKEIKVTRAAQMIFLNKTCFNGLYRVNRKGEFNVPFGRYKNPGFYDKENYYNISRTLQNSEIRTRDFEELKFNIKDNSFVYFDPPYRPISKTSSFTSYSKSDFDDDEQIRLAETFVDLDKQGSKLMLSNSDPKNYNQRDNFFEELYQGFRIHRVNANRMINCNGEKRGKINELVITNY